MVGWAKINPKRLKNFKKKMKGKNNFYLHSQKEIEKEVEIHKREIGTILKNLVEKNTSNPPGNEKTVVAYIKNYFKANKIPYKIIAKEKSRPSIIGSLGFGKKPTLMVVCHSDVVPAGSGWSTNPFKLVKKGTKWYARGVVDNKGPLAGMLCVAKILKRYESQLKGRILFAVVADEERGSVYGLKHVLKMMKKIDLPKNAIAPDTGGHNLKIEIAEKGVLWVKIKFVGTQAHGSRPELGKNAIGAAGIFIELLKNHKFLYKPHKLLKKPSMNIGKIEGGSAPNMVAA